MSWIIKQEIDLQRGYKGPQVWPDALMVSGDDKAHTWRVSVMDGGAPAGLTGASVTGYFVREDGVTVAVAGSVGGNTASVTLAQNCYAVAGRLGGVLRMERDGKTVTLSSVLFTIKRILTDSMVDPGRAFRSTEVLSHIYDELLAKTDALASGAPKGTYATVSDLQTANPDHAHIYLVTADGKWYYWSGSAWTAGGTYLADTSEAAGKINALSDGLTHGLVARDYMPVTKQGHLDHRLLAYCTITYADSETGMPFPYEKAMQITSTTEEPKVTGPHVELTKVGGLAGLLISEGKAQIAVWYNVHDMQTALNTSGGTGVKFEQYYEVKSSGILLGYVYAGGIPPSSVTKGYKKALTSQVLEISGEVEVDEVLGDWAHFTTTLNFQSSLVFDYLDVRPTLTTIKAGSSVRMSVPKLLLGGSYSMYTEYQNVTLPTVADRMLAVEQRAGLQDVVIAVRNGNNLRIRTAWSATDDMVVDGLIESEANKNFNFTIAGLIPKLSSPDYMGEAVLWKVKNDEICPAIINDSYRGGNHGIEYRYELSASTHDKSLADIGSVWTDAGGFDYVILAVHSATSLSVVSDYTGNPSEPLRKIAPVTPLTHKSGATSTGAISFTSAAQKQITPSINNRKVSIANDKSMQLDADGVLTGEHIDVRDSFDIIDTAKMLAYLKTNVGNCNNASFYRDSIKGYCRNDIIYRFNKNGSCVTYSSYHFYTDASIGYIGAVQSQKIGDVCYVPDTTLEQPQTHSGAAITMDKATYLDADKSPYRYYQWDPASKKGMALGYHLESSSVDAQERLARSTAAGYYSTSAKMYPWLINATAAQAGEYVGIMAYAIPFTHLGADPDVTSVCWYWYGDDIILMIDCHKSIDKLISLPGYMAGRKIHPMDVHQNTQILQKFVDSSGVRIKNQTYGFAVLRLSK